MSIETIYEAVLNGDFKTTEAEVNAALAAGTAAEDILRQACMPAMTEIGRLFEIEEKFVPEMIIAARAMQTAVAILRPHLLAADVKVLGKVVLGTVSGDLHDIGKNLVGMMLEGAGFEIIDLGTDVAPQTFVDAVRENEPDIVAMSALLTTTLPAMAEAMATLSEAGLRDEVKVIVGGAPVSEQFANQIGADGFATDASRAARIASALVASG